MPVLIVEDDVDTRESLEAVLNLHGLDVRTVENGQDALEFLRAAEKPPCVVVMDLMMPVMSGWDLRARMLADEQLRRIPVIVLSATADGASTLEAVAVLSKPVDFDAVTRMVKELCPSS